MAKRARKRSSRRFHCGPERQGVKTCHVGGRTIRLHAEATAATRRERVRRLAKYRFTKADARACAGRTEPKARGACMWARVRARLGR